eukprot:4994796-Pleurochrysis_carterae.AAC.1
MRGRDSLVCALEPACLEKAPAHTRPERVAMNAWHARVGSACVELADGHGVLDGVNASRKNTSACRPTSFLCADGGEGNF